MTVIRAVTPDDVPSLAALAALTFPLACPPHVTAQDAAAFVATHLSAERFADYLADPLRILLVAELESESVGYVMLVAGDPADPDVAQAVRVRPTIELSKCYVHPEHHGAGVAGALMGAAIDDAARAGAGSVWLGVNQLNLRAQAFYRKQAFEQVGVKRFLVGDRYEDDFVFERVLIVS